MAKELAALTRMGVAALRAKYAEVFGEATVTGKRTWLQRRIAWPIQALTEGDLSERARTHLRSDAEVWIRGQCYYAELDRGTMGYAQMERRFRLYEGFAHFVLWVCPTAERRDALRARAEATRRCALFTTHAVALAAPHEAIWLDYRGERVALPREGARG